MGSCNDDHVCLHVFLLLINEAMIMSYDDFVNRDNDLVNNWPLPMLCKVTIVILMWDFCFLLMCHCLWCLLIFSLLMIISCEAFLCAVCLWSLPLMLKIYFLNVLSTCPFSMIIACNSLVFMVCCNPAMSPYFAMQHVKMSHFFPSHGHCFLALEVM